MDPIVRLDQINFKYPQNRNGLKTVSMEINSGDFYFIEGHSGSGKSTLARCIAGTHPSSHPWRNGGKRLFKRKIHPRL